MRAFTLASDVLEETSEVTELGFFFTYTPYSRNAWQSQKHNIFDKEEISFK